MLQIAALQGKARKRKRILTAAGLFQVSCTDGFQKLLEIDGFHEIVEGSQLHAGDTGVEGAVAGQENHLDGGIQDFHPLKDLQAVHIRHLQVE